MARADHHGWHPAIGIGVSATFGAVARAVSTNRGLMSDPFAEPLVRAAGVEYFRRVVDNDRYAADDGDDPVTTGFIDLLATHTRFLDEFVAEAGRAGLRQVVILGSALDTRPYRLWWPHRTTVFEIDRPEVLDFKSAVLRALGARPSTNRCAVGIDLGQDWPAALRRVGFDADAPTVWIAEQLLVGYLTPAEQDRLLHAVTLLSAPGSRLAADHLPIWTPLQPAVERAFVDHWRQYGLDVDLACVTYPGEYRYVPEYLADDGWETVERDAAELFAALGPAELPRGGRGGMAAYVTATRVPGNTVAIG